MSFSDTFADFDTEAPEVTTPALDYGEWLARGKSLAAEHNNRNWLLGDWINEGDDEYNFKNLGIPDYLLIGSHPPNFWKDVSAETDLGVGTLKQLGLVARRFPPGRRIPELSWSHHQICAPYERRYEYLRAALLPGKKRHRPLDWLAEHIAKEEGYSEPEPRQSVPLRLSLPLIAKLKDVARYKGCRVQNLIWNVCAPEIQKWLAIKEREISLEMYGAYEEGLWPFDPKAKQTFDSKRRRRAKKAA